MMRNRLWRFVLSAAIAGPGLVSLGCGGTSVTTENAEPAVEQMPEGIKRRTIDSLPAIGEYLTTSLDDGRVEVAPPAGWRVLPRVSSSLANFTAGQSNNDLPRIRVAVDDPPAGVPTEVSEGNADELAAAVAKHLAAEKTGSLTEPPKALVLGDRVWSRYVRNPLSNDKPIAIQTLQTIYDGRFYTVDIIVNVKSERDYAPDLTKHRDSAYAVAAHMKFSPPGSGAFQFNMPPVTEAKPPEPAKEKKPKKKK